MTRLTSPRRVIAAAAAASSLALATTGAVSAAGASTRKHVAKSTGIVIRLEKSKKYGSVLADGAGRSLYFLSGYGERALACERGCTELWPPLLTKRRPRAVTGVEVKMLGTMKRGSLFQVTYDGHALYRYAGDTRADLVNGEDIHSFGGTWYLLGRKGSPVRAALASSGGSSKSLGGW